MKMSLLLSDEKKYWSLGQPVESSSFKKKKKWKQKRNYANEHDAKRNGWLLKEKPEKYGEGRSCKWPIFKSRTRVLQRWADYFFFKKKLQQKLVNCGSLKIIFSATVHRMAIILQSNRYVLTSSTLLFLSARRSDEAFVRKIHEKSGSGRRARHLP